MEHFRTVLGRRCGILWPVVATLLSLAVTTKPAHAFEFVDQPRSRDLVEGRNTILQCSVDDDTNIEFKWTLEGDEISEDDRRSVTDGDLTITGVDRVLDLGEFRCMATNTVTAESKTSDSAELNIIWIQPSAKVTLKSPDSLDQIEEGGRVNLNCKVDGNPLPDIAWYRDKVRLEADENVELTRSRLRLRSARTEDSGLYSCVGQNRAGQAWSSAGNLTLTILDADFPINQESPEDVLVVVGTSAQFRCSFSGNPDPDIEWYFRRTDDGNSVVHLANGTSTRIFPDGTLLISDIMLVDEGTYICIGRNGVGEADVEAQLVVAKVEDLPNLGTRMVPDGEPLSVNCTYPYGVTGGVPTPQMSWLDQSESPISDNSQDRVHTVGGTLLVFKRLREADNGNYTCKATNSAGEKTTQLVVVVATVPEFTVRPQNTSAKEMTDVWLHCQGDGNPKPQIRWLNKGKKELQDRRFVTSDNGTLHLRNLMLSDEGVYLCQIATIAGSAVAEARLAIIPVLKFAPPPSSKYLELNEKSKLVCRATARTTPIIRWFKLPNRLTQWDSHINETHGKLIFNPARKSDAGRYMCVATAGTEVINMTVTIDVFERPKFTVIPKNVTGYEGYSLTIDCQAEGDPPPRITWFGVSPAMVEAPHMVKLTNGSLVIDQVKASDAGNYQCIAGSDAGLSNMEITITVKKEIPPGSTPFTPQLMHRTIAIAVGCALAYIILVVGLMWWCRQRRRKQRRLMKEEAAAAEAAAALSPGAAGAEGEGAKLNGSLPHPQPKPYHDEEPKAAAAGMSNGDIAIGPLTKGAAGRRGSYDKLQFPRHDLQTLVVIGNGSYGEVFLARAVGITEGVEATTVMVKALQSKIESQQMDFRREIDMLSKLCHENVVKLLGMCREAEPQLMISEYLEWGDLKQYLHATQGENGTTNVPPPLTLAQKLDVVNQVAMGMEHLASYRFIHGDLAARNCLLSPAMETKVSLMSVSRDLYRAEYHEYKQKLVPVRWMPAEAIFEDELSTKSDVWAYGVFVWEVFAQGDLPYKALDNDALMRALLDGNLTLETPAGTPDEVEILMHRCWAESAKERYCFSDIVLALQNISPDTSV